MSTIRLSGIWIGYLPSNRLTSACGIFRRFCNKGWILSCHVREIEDGDTELRSQKLVRALGVVETRTGSSNFHGLSTKRRRSPQANSTGSEKIRLDTLPITLTNLFSRPPRFEVVGWSTAFRPATDVHGVLCNMRCHRMMVHCSRIMSYVSS